MWMHGHLSIYFILIEFIYKPKAAECLSSWFGLLFLPSVPFFYTYLFLSIFHPPNTFKDLASCTLSFLFFVFFNSLLLVILCWKSFLFLHEYLQQKHIRKAFYHFSWKIFFFQFLIWGFSSLIITQVCLLVFHFFLSKRPANIESLYFHLS